jgi:hypothetical protein
MSLKAFHIIFIIAATVLCLYMALWWMKESVVMAVVFFIGAAALMVYGKKAFGKLREL